jgi:hypothetical protein
VKNQYFGDVNDYRKYGLLRCLTAATGLPLGVCWLLTEPENRPDGEFRRYLDDPRRWRHYDPELYDGLRRLLDPDVRRDVHHADAWNLIPGARYYTPILRDDAAARSGYFAEGLQALAGCPLLFFDPDNGVEVPSTRIGRKRSSKYVYWPEIEEAYARGHSLVVYQHYVRVQRVPFMQGLAAECARRLVAPLVDTFATAHVVFVLIARPEHADLFAGAHARIASTWAGQIRPLAHGQGDCVTAAKSLP